jgi:hypothetical protein
VFSDAGGFFVGDDGVAERTTGGFAVGQSVQAVAVETEVSAVRADFGGNDAGRDFEENSDVGDGWSMTGLDLHSGIQRYFLTV